MLSLKSYFMAVLIMLVATVSSSPVMASTEADTCLSIDSALISRHYPYVGWQIKDISYIPDMNTCQVVIQNSGRRSVLYVSTDLKAVIAGEIFKDRKAVSQDALARMDQSVFSNTVETLDRAVAFSHKPEGATKYVYFFTDPDCAYCDRAKEKVLQWSDKMQVEVKVVFFPLQMHPNARGKAIKGICSSMTYGDYMQGKYGDKQCAEGDDKIKLSIEVAENLNITGTPTFIGAHGKKVSGFNEKLMGGIL